MNLPDAFVIVLGVIIKALTLKASQEVIDIMKGS